MRQYFLKPREAVQNALDAPSIPKMIAFVLLPTIVIFLITLALTFQVHTIDLALAFVQDLAVLLVSSLVLVILTSLFSRQMVSLHSFLGIAGALSLNGIYRSIIFIIAYLGFPLLVFPEFVQQFQLFLQNKLGLPELTQALTEMLKNFNSTQFGLSIVLLLLIGIFFLYTMYIYYLAISRTMKSTVLNHLIIAVVSIALSNFILGFILNLI